MKLPSKDASIKYMRAREEGARCALHELHRDAEHPGELQRAVEDVAEKQVVRGVLAQEAACAFGVVGMRVTI